MKSQWRARIPFHGVKLDFTFLPSLYSPQALYFPVWLSRWIVEFDESPSWFLKWSETWGEFKMPVGTEKTETGRHAITLQPQSPRAFCILPRFRSPGETKMAASRTCRSTTSSSNTPWPRPQLSLRPASRVQVSLGHLGRLLYLNLLLSRATNLRVVQCSPLFKPWKWRFKGCNLYESLVVNVLRFSEVTWSISWCPCIMCRYKEGS